MQLLIEKTGFISFSGGRMLRGKLSNRPMPRVWLDWRVLMKQLSTPMKLVTKVVNNTIMFDWATKKLPIDKSVLRWIHRNHYFAFDIIVIGEGTGCLDYMLRKRLKDTWVRQVYWLPVWESVLEEMQRHVGVVAYLTKDKMLLDSSKDVYEFTGPSMDLKHLPG